MALSGPPFIDSAEQKTAPPPSKSWSGQESVELEVTAFSEKRTSQMAWPGVRMCLEIIQSLKLALPGAKLVSPDVELSGLNAEGKNARK